MDEIINIRIKLIAVGDVNVGKTSLIQSYISGNIIHNYVSTVGIDFCYKNFMVNNYNVDLHIWDTSGQERFMSIITQYYRGTHAVMLVFDLGILNSFNNIKFWLNQINSRIERTSFSAILIGNKSDQNSIISSDMIQSLLNEYPNIKYIETCVTTNTNINLAFNTLITDCIENNLFQFKKPNNNIVLEKEHNDTYSCC